MASSHPAWSYWSDATVLDDYAMTTTTTITICINLIFPIRLSQYGMVYQIMLSTEVRLSGERYLSSFSYSYYSNNT